MNENLFKGIESYMVEENRNKKEKSFISRNEKYFKDEICSLVAIKSKVLEKDIRYTYLQNMYKYRGFMETKNMMKNEISTIILNYRSKENLTELEISSVCNNATNQSMRKNMGALIMSFMYLFLDKYENNVGAGDLATSSLPVNLNANADMTKVYNRLVNSSLPTSISIFESPSFFVQLDMRMELLLIPQMKLNSQVQNIRQLRKLTEPNDITYEAMRNYYFLWQTYNNNNKNFTLYCDNNKKRVNCSDPTKFKNVTREIELEHVESLRKNPTSGRLVEGSINGPPCMNEGIIKKFKIDPICKMQKSVSDQKEAFLKLMKFTKQSPTFQETDEESASIFKSVDESLLYGFILKKDCRHCHQRPNAFVAFCNYGQSLELEFP